MEKLTSVTSYRISLQYLPFKLDTVSTDEEAGPDSRRHQEPSTQPESHTEGSGKTSERIKEYVDSLGTREVPIRRTSIETVAEIGA